MLLLHHCKEENGSFEPSQGRDHLHRVAAAVMETQADVESPVMGTYPHRLVGTVDKGFMERLLTA